MKAVEEMFGFMPELEDLDDEQELVASPKQVVVSWISLIFVFYFLLRTSYLSKKFRCLLVGETSQGRRF